MPGSTGWASATGSVSAWIRTWYCPLSRREHLRSRCAKGRAPGRRPFAGWTMRTPGWPARGERSFLQCLEGDCSVPLAALCEVLPGSRARLRGLVCSLDGARIIRSEREVEASPAAVCEAGEAVARDVLDKGGAEILDALHAEGPA